MVSLREGEDCGEDCGVVRGRDGENKEPAYDDEREEEEEEDEDEEDEEEEETGRRVGASSRGVIREVSSRY